MFSVFSLHKEILAADLERSLLKFFDFLDKNAFTIILNKFVAKILILFGIIQLACALNKLGKLEI